MPRSRDHLLDVELLEDDPAEPVPPSPPVARRWRPVVAAVPRRVRALVAVLGVLALTAGAGTVVVRHVRDAALDARLADVAGLSAPLTRPLAEAWGIPASGVLAGTDDLVLLGATGAQGVLAVDLATGRARYARDGGCQVVPGDPAALPRPSVVTVGGTSGVDPDDLLVCVHDPWADATGAERDPLGPFGPFGAFGPSALGAVASVHAVGTGDLLRSIPLTAAETWSVVDDAVVGLGFDADRHVTATSWSVRTGDRRWAYRSPDPAPRSGDGWSSTMSDVAVGYRIGDWVRMVDPSTGEPVAAPSTSDSGTFGPTEVADGVTVTGRYSAGRTETRVDAGGGRSFTVPGYVLVPAVDDGTAEGLLLVVEPDGRTDPALVGVDVATGVTRWSADVAVGEVVALSGVVVVHDGGGLTAVDAATGRTRWAQRTGDPEIGGWRIVTDGRRVLTVERSGSAGPSLVARDVRTGEPAWAVEAPVADGALQLAGDGTVLLVGATRTVALRG